MKRPALAVTAAIAVLLVQAAGARQAGQADPARGQRNPRDQSAQARQATGTASLSGRVVAGDTGRPLGRARVFATAGEMPSGVSTLTDADGRFTLANLPAGAFTLSASKIGYVTLNYGAVRPQRPGRRVTVAAGQEVRNIDIRLPRGGVITGRVFDEMGDPLIRTTVRALRYQYQQGERSLVAAGSEVTDDRGQYRIFGLVPGNYVLAATARPDFAQPDDLRPADPSFSQSYAPTYYPGVTSQGDAATVVVGMQQEVSGIDFQLTLVTTARVSGVVTAESGRLANTSVIVVPEDERGSSLGSGPGTVYGARVLGDGTFTIASLPPGRYLAVARGSVDASRRGSPMVGVQAFSVAGQDLDGLQVALTAGTSVSGAITAESASGRPVDYTQVRLTLGLATPIPNVSAASGRVQPDGTFTIPDVPAGSHLLRVAAPQGWVLKGVFLGTRDVSDAPFEVRPGVAAGSLHVVLTDQPTEIAGKVVDDRSEPVADCYVIAFSADSANWRPRSRTIQGIRPDQAGTYRVRGLPPGRYYLVALPDIEPGSWFEPALLEELAKEATSVTLGEGEARMLDLPIKGAR